MAPSPSSTSIPFFYRFVFLVLDPMIALWGAYLNIFTPAFAVNAYIPAALAPHNPLHAFLQHQIAGGLVCCAVLDVLLLARTREVWIWKAQQYAQLAYDVVILWSTWYSLQQQGRLSLAGLRAEDWGGLAVTGFVTAVRTGFVLGLGLGKSAGKANKR